MIVMCCVQRHVLALTLDCWYLWDCETIQAALSQRPLQL